MCFLQIWKKKINEKIFYYSGDSDIGESRQSFEEKIKDMTRLVKAQLECYKDEEAKLKVEFAGSFLQLVLFSKI